MFFNHHLTKTSISSLGHMLSKTLYALIALKIANDL